ncbi:MAG: BlaI/MecI/CopY family transcriptional regulator [bacterium]|nr:BlaI/MecI/CopY family transcriptional regulator [bacterium]
MSPVQRPSELELQVLSVLWENGPLTARDVNERMPDGKTRAYTTVLSVLQGMERKGLVAHRSEGRTHVYRAKPTRERILGPMLRGLVRNVFGGSPSAVMQHLLEDTDVSDDEREAIRKLLDEEGGEVDP